uniref:Holocarboxylase synthetase n=1 Tax=Arundo donax TaxID=35708 RepID=A0A0A9FPC4_ARUDO
MHLAFRGAANALSQVYTQAVAHQKASFLAGERRAMDNVYRWLSSQHEQASELLVADVLAYLQNEIAHRIEDTPASPQHPSSQPPYNFPSANVQSNAFSFGNVAAALNSWMGEPDQRNASISNALPNPLSTNFQSTHLIQSSGYGPIRSLPNGNGARNNYSPQSQDCMHYNSYEPSMDMHHDGP